MIPLIVRSHFSLMCGVPSVERLCQGARQRGYDRLALTDTDNLYGLWSFLAACRRTGLRPIIGAELTDPRSGPDPRARAVLLVTAPPGFARLCQLLTQRHLDPQFAFGPAVSQFAGGGPSSGLLVLTADAARLTEWKAADVDLVASLARRACRSTNPLVRTASHLGVPLAATPDSYLLDPDDNEMHRVLRAIALNTAVSRLPAEALAAPDAWLASPAEYRRRFADLPEALRGSAAVSEKCSGFSEPDTATVLPPWAASDDATAVATLRERAYAGARRRYGADLSEVVVARLEHELALIELKQFSSYFLVVEDIVRRSPRICGRGSGAASLVAYCLGITNVCPIRYNLYFERFLNPGRSDPPDIDIDFAWDERDAVITSVLEQHRLHAAMVCNHVLFQPRMAIREVAKVFGLADGEIGQVCRRLPWLWQGGHPGGENGDTPDELEHQLRQLPELKAIDFPEPWPAILRLAQQLIGTPRYLSVHPGGLVLTPRPIAQHAPVERAAKGVPILQWEKDGTEEAGMVKIDLLGNRSLAVIRDAIANLRDNGLPFDERSWQPEDDPATQQMVAHGQTMGCFYVESPAMRLLLQRAGLGDFEHLVIFSSIIRPAANDYIREYLHRLQGGAWEPLHPLLADVLDETLGIMVYQEDVSKTAVALAGFSHADADGLRKVLSKKNRALRLQDYRSRFVAGAIARGVEQTTIDAVWDMMMSFDGYSFCKPHSASYARVSFQAAFLKRHVPAEFMAAVISNRGGFYSTFAYVSEARRLGLTVLPPDVNRSAVRWRGRGRRLRTGLMAVAELGHATQERIVAARGRNGDFHSMEDWLDRTRPDEQEARALILAGACDSLAPGKDRATLLWHLARWHRLHGRDGRKTSATTGDLFSAATLPEPPLPAGNELDRLRRQFAVLGFLCDRHPMTLYETVVARQRTICARDLAAHVGRRVRLAGWLITGKIVQTKAGEPMEFLTFEDETGLVETTFFPDAYRRFCDQLDGQRPLLLEGLVEQDFGVCTLTVDRVRRLPLPEAR